LPHQVVNRPYPITPFPTVREILRETVEHHARTLTYGWLVKDIQGGKIGQMPTSIEYTRLGDLFVTNYRNLP
jgi:hypothetical protein